MSIHKSSVTQISERARQLIASLLVPTDAPFREYLKATDYCTAVINYTDLEADREYFAQWRAAFAALMVITDTERQSLLHQLRKDYEQERSPLPTLRALRP